MRKPMEILLAPSGRLRDAAVLAALLAVLALALAGCGDGEASLTRLGIAQPVQRAADIPATNTFAPPVTTPLAISSTFGPRWKYSESRYDFHRGIDYYGTLGDPLLSIGNGTVVGVYPDGSAQYPNGGNVLVIRYDLASPFPWQGTTVDRIYALYLHMDTFGVSLNDPVSTGQVVGTMGQTGATTFTHLHFEIRVQTTCSLEYQLANPGVCDSGFDPHVHPYVFVGGENADQVTLSQQPGDPRVQIYEATRGDLDLNVLETNLGTLNFNRRTGIDASSTAVLDDFDYGWVVVVPDVFVSASDTIRYEFHFATTPAYLELRDIWGYGIRRTY